MSSPERFSLELRSAFGLKPRSEWNAALVPALDELSRSEELGEMLGDERRREALLYQLVTRVTVGETHFYRHSEQLEKVTRYLLELDAARPRDARLNVWSAGCASGEEPYSIAILLERALGERLSQRVRIFANDVSRDAIARAREATYTAWSFRGTPGWFFQHFQRTAGGRLRLDHGAVRDVVEFTVLACRERALAFAEGSLDLITFRNVAIYLEAEAIEILYREFHRVLAADGLLAIGPSDPRPPAALFTPTEVTFVYQRKGEAAQKPALSALPLRAVKATPPAARVTATPRPLLQAPRLASVRPLPPQPSLSTAEAARHALALGDAGKRVHALELARGLVAAEPSSAVALRILGQLLLESGELAAAVQTLRQALYFDPRAALARFFLATALKERGDQEIASKELEVLSRELATRDRDELLDDGETRVAELAEAARYLLGQWR